MSNNGQHKMAINEEIKRFFLEFELREKILPYNSLPEYLQKLQNIVILTHRDLDVDMLVRIMYQIQYEAGDGLKSKTWDKIDVLIQSALEQIPYISKVDLIESFGDMPEPLKKSLVKLNTYRNRFAHPKIDLLLNEYDVNSLKGRDNIQALIRALKNARDLFLKYAESSSICNYCMNKEFKKGKTAIAKQS